MGTEPVSSYRSSKRVKRARLRFIGYLFVIIGYLCLTLTGASLPTEWERRIGDLVNILGSILY